MIYDEENWDYCELLNEELARGGDDAFKYCELCELQRSTERMVSGVMSVDMNTVKQNLKN